MFVGVWFGWLVACMCFVQSCALARTLHWIATLPVTAAATDDDDGQTEELVLDASLAWLNPRHSLHNPMIQVAWSELATVCSLGR